MGEVEAAVAIAVKGTIATDNLVRTHRILKCGNIIKVRHNKVTHLFL